MSRQGLSPTAAGRLLREEQILKNEAVQERLFIAKPRMIDNIPHYKTWDVYFLLKTDDSLYKDKVIEAEMTFPEIYPLRPPKFIFKSEMWHPNIHADGNVCISILEEDVKGPFEHGSPEDKWSPVQSIRTILLSIVILLDNPNPDSPANVDATKMYRNDIEEYKKTVSSLIDRQHALSMKKDKVKKAIQELNTQ